MDKKIGVDDLRGRLRHPIEETRARREKEAREKKQMKGSAIVVPVHRCRIRKLVISVGLSLWATFAWQQILYGNFPFALSAPIEFAQGAKSVCIALQRERSRD